MPVLKGSYCYFDTETTGHDPWAADDRVLQVALLLVRDGEIKGTLDLILDPGREIPAEVIPIHGITREMTAGQPSFGQILPAVLAMMRSARVVIHNAPFDLAFLDQAMVASGMHPEELEIADTLQIARAHCHFPAGNALRKIADHYGVETPEPHRALTDVIILREVAERMFADLGIGSDEGMAGLSGIYRRPVGIAPVVPEFWAEAIGAGLEVRVRYGGAGERVILPRRFYIRYGQEYLDAHCLLAGRELTFRVDRLEVAGRE